MELIVFAVPPVVTGIMFVFKKIAGYNWFVNGAQAQPWLRTLLIVLSLVGMLSTSLVTGEQINLDSVTSLATLGISTALSAYGSHWLYVLATFIRNWKDYL
jgi:hypothetical protein